jgi:ArsR family transcriptional regulator
MPTASLERRYSARVRVLRALAHPTRLFLVEELAGGERSVQELTELVGDDMSTVSKHLTVLREAGVLAAERRGQQVFHRLRIPCVLDVFRCVQDVLDDRSAGERGEVRACRARS